MKFTILAVSIVLLLPQAAWPKSYLDRFYSQKVEEHRFGQEEIRILQDDFKNRDPNNSKGVFPYCGFIIYL